MKKELVFYNLIGFYSNKDHFKKIFDELKIEEVEIYRMYIYSLPFMDDNTKDLIWEYLNGWEESRKDLRKKYKEAKRKLDRRRKNAIYLEMETK